MLDITDIKVLDIWDIKEIKKVTPLIKLLLLESLNKNLPPHSKENIKDEKIIGEEKFQDKIIEIICDFSSIKALRPKDKRVLILMHKDKPIGFEYAYITDEGIGYRNFLYIIKSYRGEKVLLDDNPIFLLRYFDLHIEHWFKEENITKYMTETGLLMKKNILAYLGAGFIPVEIAQDNDFPESGTVYMLKDILKPCPHQTIIEYAKLLHNNQIYEIINRERRKEEEDGETTKENCK